jgi:hypothetical protein
LVVDGGPARGGRGETLSLDGERLPDLGVDPRIAELRLVEVARVVRGEGTAGEQQSPAVEKPPLNA